MQVRPHAPPTGADAVPDSRGLNLYRADPDLRRLLGLYLPADLAAHMEPHLDRLGALAGGALDDLAATADRNPPRRCATGPAPARTRNPSSTTPPTARWSASPSGNSAWPQ